MTYYRESDRPPYTAEAEAFLTEMLLIYPVLGVQVFEKATKQPSSSGSCTWPARARRLVGPRHRMDSSSTPDRSPVSTWFHRSTSTAPSYGTPSSRRGGSSPTERTSFSRRTTSSARPRRRPLVPRRRPLVMLGRTANGRIEWRSADGKRLKELQPERAEGLPGARRADGSSTGGRRFGLNSQAARG